MRKMRKPIVHLWLRLGSCTLVLLLLCLVTSARRMGLESVEATEAGASELPPPVPTAPETETVPTTDFDLNFESVTSDSDLESLETTTSGTTPFFKTGRHFGSRIRGVTPNSSNGATGSNVNSVVFPPALRPRPTSSVISFNPSNYNRIVKRRKNSTLTNSTLQKNGTSQEVLPITLSAETTEQPPATTTVPTVTSSQSALLQAQARRKLLFGLRTTRPPPITLNDTAEPPTESPSESESSMTGTEPTFFIPKHRRVKIPPLRVPSLLRPSPTAQPVSQSPVTSAYVPPPSASFEYNPSYTVDDGIYRFKYSTQPQLSSRRVHSEEFGITRESYGDEGPHENVGDEEDPSHIEDETTLRNPLDNSTPRVPLQVNIDGSEEEYTSSLPTNYRGTFSQEQAPEPQAVRHAPESPPRAVTVTVTVTETSAPASVITPHPFSHQPLSTSRLATHEAHENDLRKITASVSPAAVNAQNDNVINLFAAPTPALPPLHEIHASSSIGKVEQTAEFKLNTNENVGGDSDPLPIVITSTTTETVMRAPTTTGVEGGPNQGVNSIEVLRVLPEKSLSSSLVLSPTPTQVTSTKEFKSVFYSAETHPHFSSTSFSYSSSTEYSFFTPEDEDHQHHHDPEEEHPHDHHGSPEDDQSAKEPEIRPSTSSMGYWDSLGLKTAHVDFNTSSSENLPSPSPSSPPRDLVGGFSTPEAATEAPIGPGIRRLTTPPPSSQHPPFNDMTSSEEGSSKVSSEEDSTKEDSSSRETHLPPVAVFIQVLLDMPSTQFCPSVTDFKKMIILIYTDNKRQVSLDQVVLFSEPDCSTLTNAKSKNSNSSAQLMGPNNSANTLLMNSRLPNDKMNKTKRTHTEDTVTTYYPVYVYLNDKNGSYDQSLTESFIDLWNLTKADDGLFFNKIKKVEMITSSQGITGHAPANENSGIIAAITIASIAAVSLLLLGVLLLVMRHRQAKTKFAKRCTPVTLDDYSLDNISVFNSFRRKQRIRASKRSYTNNGFDDPNAPSKVLDIPGLAGAVVKENHSFIFDEFSRIPSVNPTLDDIPNGAEAKNRYANVIPMPDSRVLLTFQDEQPNSDYINANYVRGANNANKAYIITQGPLEETVVDFWRMVWEQQVRVIFMLTDFSEAGIPKCADYYPRSETIDCSQLHGDFQITLEKRDFSENCITSFLVIKDMERSLRRDIVHLWYHSWPEKGIPENPNSTVDFLIRSRKYTKEPCAVLVHCSPGTGRSGTIAACDIGIKELEVQRKVDIPQIVKRIRQDRAGAVQTKDQYKHIYEVINNYASKHLGSGS